MLEKENYHAESAILVGVTNRSQQITFNQTIEFLNELEFLALTLGIKTRKKIIQRQERPDPRTFVGKGKLYEIALACEETNVDTVIFDDELSPSQLRNIEKELGLRIYDRSLLILDIFLFRAKSHQAKLQVELARYQYLLPRLTRMWTHLERQRGGTSTRGGAGEKEIETDKRIIRDKISLLREKLKKIDKQAITRRKAREGLVRVALIGYTNVGKSTLMQILSKADAFAEDKLFATVDSLVRRVELNRIPFLLTDTVGFIRKLPHSLIEAFKSTLDEVKEADILVHVVDISTAQYEDQIKTVNDTLFEIGAVDKPTLIVFNKIDCLDQDRLSWIKKGASGIIHNGFEQSFDKVFISAGKGQNIKKLRHSLFEKVKTAHLHIYPNYLKKE
jgi:GTP-binding protein HflX